jgi:hypothetical protein
MTKVIHGQIVDNFFCPWITPELSTVATFCCIKKGCPWIVIHGQKKLSTGKTELSTGNLWITFSKMGTNINNYYKNETDTISSNFNVEKCPIFQKMRLFLPL